MTKEQEKFAMEIAESYPFMSDVQRGYIKGTADTLLSIYKKESADNENNLCGEFRRQSVHNN